MRKFTADFETNVSETDCRVWAYALCEIGNTDNFIYGDNIEDFIKWCSNKKENYDYLSKHIKTIVSDDIYSGIKIVYKDKVYDFSLSERNA